MRVVSYLPCSLYAIGSNFAVIPEERIDAMTSCGDEVYHWIDLRNCFAKLLEALRFRQEAADSRPTQVDSKHYFEVTFASFF